MWDHCNEFDGHEITGNCHNNLVPFDPHLEKKKDQWNKPFKLLAKLNSE